ncbi:MAG: hypothetical protein QW607_11180 [Desulfurococcaceae archaeon]
MPRTEYYKRVFERGLRYYKDFIRKRTGEVIREFLRVERLPRRLTYREAKDVIKSVVEGRKRVKFMYDWVMKYRGEWLAKKWSWYLRSKTFWREQFEELYREIERYEKLYQHVKRNYIRLLAQITAYVRGTAPTEIERCAQYKRFGAFAKIFDEIRSIILRDTYMLYAVTLRDEWPNRRFRVTLFYRYRNVKAEKDSDDYGAYLRDVGYGRRPYFVYTFVVYGKELPDLLKRTGYHDLEAMVVVSFDRIPVPKDCI